MYVIRIRILMTGFIGFVDSDSDLGVSDSDSDSDSSDWIHRIRGFGFECM